MMMIAILSHGIGVVARGPELSTPEILLHFGMGEKDIFGSDVFDFCDDTGEGLIGSSLQEEMDMIFVDTNLKEMYFIGWTEFETESF